MRVLILFCHPARSSFIGAVLGDVEAALAACGHEADVLDLYAAGFDPSLSAAELAAYWTPDQDDPLIRQVRAADALIAIYPTWWYSLPARLKGYFDRVWRPNVAFTLAPGGIDGALTNIRRLIVVTTYGSSRAYIEEQIGDPGAAFWLRGMAPLLAPDCEIKWCALYGMDESTEAGRQTFRQEVRQALDILA